MKKRITKTIAGPGTQLGRGALGASELSPYTANICLHHFKEWYKDFAHLSLLLWNT